MGILYVLLNILPISLLSRVHIVMSFYILKKINEMQVASYNFWLNQYVSQEHDILIIGNKRVFGPGVAR